MTSSRERFAAAVRTDPVDLGLACLLMGAEADPTLDVTAALATLDALAASARSEIAATGAEEGLRTVLRGFHGTPADFELLDSSLLHRVLRRQRGLPILLSVVWLEVARRLEVPAVPLGLPGHFVVQVAGRAVDPYAGGVPLLAVPHDARAYDDHELLLRVLTNIRAWAAREPFERAAAQLWATELSLLLPRHPAALRRERGLLLGRRGAFDEGAAELEAYADAVEPADAAAADEARREARLLQSRLN